MNHNHTKACILAEFCCIGEFLDDFINDFFRHFLYWLFAKTTIVCRKCKGENCLVPMKSPRGQEILYGGVGQNGGGNPRLVQAKKIIIKKKIVFKKPVVNVDKEK